MIETVTQTELAYIAGIIDGEGSIGIYGDYRRPGHPGQRAQVSIYNANRELLEWISSKVGGNKPIARQPNGHGSFKTNKEVFSVYWSHQKARILLEQVLPYLRLKKEVAERAITVQRTGRRHISK